METFENVWKYSKNGVKRLKIFENWCETFENIWKYSKILTRFYFNTLLKWATQVSFLRGGLLTVLSFEFLVLSCGKFSHRFHRGNSAKFETNCEGWHYVSMPPSANEQGACERLAGRVCGETFSRCQCHLAQNSGDCFFSRGFRRLRPIRKR